MSNGLLDSCIYDPDSHPDSHETLYGHLAIMLSTVHPENMDEVINRCLAMLGEAHAVDRVYVFRLDSSLRTMSNTHEWFREAISPEIDRLQNMPFDQYQYTLRHFEQNKILNVSRIEDLPPEAGPERELFILQNIRSCFMVPTRSARGLEGFVGFDAVREHRQWTDLEVGEMQLFAQLLANTVDRCQLEVENRYHIQCLSEAVVKLAEAEKRLRFALTNELHDGVAQFLAIAHMRLQTLHKRIEDPSLSEQLDPIARLLDQAITQIRQTMLNASPQWITRAGGLCEALQQAVANTGSHCTTDFTLQCPDDLEVTENQALLIYQVTQELLFNVVKHAHARKCRIRVRQTREALTIGVSDNGCGFTTGNLWQRGRKLPTSFGMLSLQLRVEAQRGQLRVFSRPGLGTCVRVTLPMVADHPSEGSRLLKRQEDADDGASNHAD